MSSEEMIIALDILSSVATLIYLLNFDMVIFPYLEGANVRHALREDVNLGDSENHGSIQRLPHFENAGCNPSVLHGILIFLVLYTL